MDIKETQNCWEIHNCPEETKKKCPAFPSYGSKCWEVASSSKKTGCPLTRDRGRFSCINQCAWFRKLNPSVDK